MLQRLLHFSVFIWIAIAVFGCTESVESGLPPSAMTPSSDAHTAYGDMLTEHDASDGASGNDPADTSTTVGTADASEDPDFGDTLEADQTVGDSGANDIGEGADGGASNGTNTDGSAGNSGTNGEGGNGDTDDEGGSSGMQCTSRNQRPWYPTWKPPKNSQA